MNHVTLFMSDQRSTHDIYCALFMKEKQAKLSGWLIQLDLTYRNTSKETCYFGFKKSMTTKRIFLHHATWHTLLGVWSLTKLVV